MVQYRKPLERSENLIDRRPFAGARRGRAGAGAAAAREEAERLLAEALSQALKLRRQRGGR